MTALLSPRVRRTVGLLLAVVMITSVVAGGAVVAATATGEQDEGDASVRIVHASPDAPDVDVSIDDETVLEDVSFGTVSDYLDLSEGTHTVTVTLSDDPEEVVYEDEFEVEAGESYTAAATGEVTEDAETSFEPVVLSDNATEPADDEAAVRLAHFSPDAPAVDVTVEESGDVLFEDVSFREATEYATVPEGDYTLEVRPATEDNDGDVVATFDVTAEGGTAYTAFAVGYVDTEAAGVDAPFDLAVGTDMTADSDEDDEEDDDDETETESDEETETPTETPSDD